MKKKQYNKQNHLMGLIFEIIFFSVWFLTALFIFLSLSSQCVWLNSWSSYTFDWNNPTPAMWLMLGKETQDKT